MKPENDLRRLDRAEAERALDVVRKRYGIHPPDQQPSVAPFSTAPKLIKEQQPQRPPGPSAVMRPLAPVKSMYSPLDLGWVYPSSSPIAAQSASDDQWFHYLIRIAECALPLHCEIKARNEEAAWHYVEQIPNLLESRKLAREELAELIRNERAHATKAMVGRLSRGAKHYALAKKGARRLTMSFTSDEQESDAKENCASIDKLNVESSCT